MSGLSEALHEAAKEHSRSIAVAINTAMGQAALKNEGGVRVTRTMWSTTVAYDPTAPYLTVVYEATVFGPEVEA